MFTAVGVVPGIWAPKSEANTFMAVLSCAYQLSNIVCMPVSGILCESVLGWRSIYYLFGSLTLMVYILFWFTYSDNPEDNRYLSAFFRFLIFSTSSDSSLKKNYLKLPVEKLRR